MKRLNLRSITFIGMLCLLGMVACRDNQQATRPLHSPQNSVAGQLLQADNNALLQAIEQQRTYVFVSGHGVVIKILPDDNSGSKHQRFLLDVGAKQSLLIAHNIDIAQYVSPLNVGDTVDFAGEYIWNNKGGLVHWTHHDPSGQHQAGYLTANGIHYQ